MTARERRLTSAQQKIYDAMEPGIFYAEFIGEVLGYNRGVLRRLIDKRMIESAQIEMHWNYGIQIVDGFRRPASPGEGGEKE